MDYKNFSNTAVAVPLDAFNITPGASPLTTPVRQITADTVGTVTVTTYAGRSLTFTIGPGNPLTLVVTHVTAATATGLKGFV
jgi:hypothetical protein